MFTRFSAPNHYVYNKILRNITFFTVCDFLLPIFFVNKEKRERNNVRVLFFRFRIWRGSGSPWKQRSREAALVDEDKRRRLPSVQSRSQPAARVNWCWRGWCSTNLLIRARWNQTAMEMVSGVCVRQFITWMGSASIPASLPRLCRRRRQRRRRRTRLAAPEQVSWGVKRSVMHLSPKSFHPYQLRSRPLSRHLLHHHPRPRPRRHHLSYRCRCSSVPTPDPWPRCPLSPSWSCGPRP